MLNFLLITVSERKHDAQIYHFITKTNILMNNNSLTFYFNKEHSNSSFNINTALRSPISQNSHNHYNLNLITYKLKGIY